MGRGSPFPWAFVELAFCQWGLSVPGPHHWNPPLPGCHSSLVSTLGLKLKQTGQHHGWSLGSWFIWDSQGNAPSLASGREREVTGLLGPFQGEQI